MKRANPLKQTSRNLVVVRAGDGSLHQGWLNGSERPDFDLIVSYFGDDPDAFRTPDENRVDQKGGYWDGVYKLFGKHPELVDRYEYFLLADDDLEMQAQETHIDPGAMIITRLANTAIDRVAGDEGRIAGEIVQFSASDMVCYRADAPDSLVARQAERWDPVLDWAHRALGCRFICVAGVMHQAQPEGSLDKLRTALDRESPWRLTAIHNTTTLTGSALVGMMVAAGELSGEDA
jgi:hypothetical protein